MVFVAFSLFFAKLSSPFPDRSPYPVSYTHLGLQSRAGHTHKHLAGGGNGVDVGTGTGEHHTGAAQVLVYLLRALLELLKAVAAAGNQDVDAGVRCV